MQTDLQNGTPAIYPVSFLHDFFRREIERYYEHDDEAGSTHPPPLHTRAAAGRLKLSWPMMSCRDKQPMAS